MTEGAVDFKNSGVGAQRRAYERQHVLERKLMKKSNRVRYTIEFFGMHKIVWLGNL